jgi:chromosomal replication initiator protein
VSKDTIQVTINKDRKIVITDIWSSFLHIVRNEVGSRVVETWFKAVSFHRWDSVNKSVYLEAPNAFVKNWIQNNYLDLIKIHLGRLLHVDKPDVIFIDDLHKVSTPAHDMIIPAHSVAVMPADVKKPSTEHEVKNALIKPSSLYQGQINRAYSFDTFVVGPTNSLAYAAAYAITEKPGKLYNPLFIYGGSGLGKTHLLHAIGNAIKERQTQATVLYQTADRFVNEFINAIRFDKVHKFQAKYHMVDVLLIDDMQFMANKEQTQEAFFHMFNILYESHKQIVFSSDTMPHTMHGMAERLRSRLAWGLVTDIHVPHLETKIAILKKKAQMSEHELSDDVAYFIAERVTSNIRELEGALIRVMAFASLTNQAITLELARKVLRPEEKVTAVDFNRIVSIIKNHYSYDLADLCSKDRNKDLAFTRQLAMFLMKKLTDKSLRDIGQFLGGRNHATVVHAINKIEMQRKTDVEFQHRINKIESEITG